MVSICTRLVGNNAGPWTEIGSCKLKNPGGGDTFVVVENIKKKICIVLFHHITFPVNCQDLPCPLPPPPSQQVLPIS